MIVKFRFFNNLIGSTLAVCLIATISIMDITYFILALVDSLEMYIEVFEVTLNRSTSLNNFNKLYTFVYAANAIFFTFSLYNMLISILYCLISCVAFPLLIQFFGRRIGLIILSLLMLVTTQVDIFFYVDLTTKLVLHFAIAFIILMTYTSEISIPSKRGVIMSLVFSMQSLAIYFKLFQLYYRILLDLIFSIIPILLVIIFCEETPQFYVMKNKVEKASRSLGAFRETDNDNDGEIQEIQSKIQSQNEIKFRKLLKKTTKKQNILFCVYLYLTGEVFITLIFWMLGLIGKNMYNVYNEYLTIIIILSYCVLPAIIDFVDRKILLFSLIATMAGLKTIWTIIFICGGITLPWLPALVFTLFTSCYTMASGLIWVIITEIAPTRVKIWSLSFGIAITVGSLLPLVVLLHFVHILIFLQQPIVAVMLSLGYWPILLFLMIKYKHFIVETRGITLEQIYNDSYT